MNASRLVRPSAAKAFFVGEILGPLGLTCDESDLDRFTKLATAHIEEPRCMCFRAIKDGTRSCTADVVFSPDGSIEFYTDADIQELSRVFLFQRGDGEWGVGMDTNGTMEGVRILDEYHINDVLTYPDEEGTFLCLSEEGESRCSVISAKSFVRGGWLSLLLKDKPDWAGKIPTHLFEQ